MTTKKTKSYADEHKEILAKKTGIGDVIVDIYELVADTVKGNREIEKEAAKLARQHLAESRKAALADLKGLKKQYQTALDTADLVYGDRTSMIDAETDSTPGVLPRAAGAVSAAFQKIGPTYTHSVTAKRLNKELKTVVAAYDIVKSYGK